MIVEVTNTKKTPVGKGNSGFYEIGKHFIQLTIIDVYVDSYGTNVRYMAREIYFKKPHFGVSWAKYISYLHEMENVYIITKVY